MAEKTESTAGPKLAAIAELVESILLELPLQDALLAQRVDRTWHATIKNSPKLQKAFCFRPCADDALIIKGLSDYSQLPCDCENATEPPKAHHLHRPQRTIEQRWAHDETDMHLYDVSINPFLLKGQKGKWHMVEGGIEQYRRATPEASLRRMLLTQPPVKMIILYTTSTPAHLVSCKSGSDGVTVGQVFDALATLNTFYFMQIWRGICYTRHDVEVDTGRQLLRSFSEYVRDHVLEKEPEIDPYYEADSDLEY